MEPDPTNPHDPDSYRPSTPLPLPACFDEHGRIILKCLCGHNFTTAECYADHEVPCPACGMAVDIPPASRGSLVPTVIEGQEAPSPARELMETELRKWGVGLMVIGGLSIALSDFLDPIWGGGLIILGILSFLIRHCAMFIVFGCLLVLAGLMNLAFGGVKSPGWAVFGVIQIIWGVQEFRRFAKFNEMLNK